MLLLARPPRHTVQVIPNNLSTSAAQLLEKVHIQLPAASGGTKTTGELSRVRPVFQLVVPQEIEVPATDPVDWAEGGPGKNSNGLPSGMGNDTGGVNYQTTSVLEPIAEDPDEPFIPFERDPSFSISELRSAVRYPELAVRRQIEGKVIIKAYIGADGSISNAAVVSSDNALLDDAALNGVRSIRYEPALQNERPTGCWIFIPVSFELGR
ncbi:MAG: energy transducer TonB [bacterium]|nr:energy transducer TonB [bacterium]